MQHAIMTLNNPSGVEIMTAENGNHIQVSCIALISCERIALDNLDVLHMHKRFEIIDKSFLVKDITQKCALNVLKAHFILKEFNCSVFSCPDNS